MTNTKKELFISARGGNSINMLNISENGEDDDFMSFQAEEDRKSDYMNTSRSLP